MQLHSLTLAALDRSEQSTSHDHFTPENKAQCPSKRRLHGPERQFGQSVVENLLPMAGCKPSSHYIQLSRLLRKNGYFCNWLNIKYEDKWDNDGTILNIYFICYYMIMSQWYNTSLYQNQSAIKTRQYPLTLATYKRYITQTSFTFEIHHFHTIKCG